MSFTHDIDTSETPVDTVDAEDRISLLRVGLIGDPVAHSFSPRLQQAAFDALAIPARYELWHTPAEQLASRVAALLAPACLGANVTIPHKQAVLPMLDIVNPLAARIGAVNTIVQRDEYLYGYNTDAPALLQVLAEHGIGEAVAIDVAESGKGSALRSVTRGSAKERPGLAASPLTISLKGYTAVLLGAGGAARSAAFALVEAGVERLIIVNRSLERAQHLASDVQKGSNCKVFSLNDPAYVIARPRSIIINATPLGMHNASIGKEAEDASPLPAEILARFDPDTLVLDMVYNPTETKLLCQSLTLGLRAVNGLSMLLHQGALAFTLWTGQPAPLEAMRAALFSP
jgi:shikimate dehydrogenase